MRIAMLSWESLHSIAVGGVAAHVSELSAALAAKGHSVHVFTRRSDGQSHYECVEGVHYYRCDYVYSHDFVDDVNSMCRAIVDRVMAVENEWGAFDIVHAHDWLAANAMIWLKQARGRRSVLTVHSTEFGRCGNSLPDGPSVRIRAQEAAGTYWADHVIAVSQATRDEIGWLYGTPQWKSSVVYNGVIYRRFDSPVDAPQLRSRYGINQAAPTVLFCGRMVYQKGPDLLVEAIPGILRFYPETRFVFAGDGHMRSSLEDRAWRLGVSQAVRFLGYRNGGELIGLFKMSDVVCVPSRNEPFGIVVLEAWAAGKPVVATQNGGPNEYVEHGVNGLKIYPNPDSVGWGLGNLLWDADRIHRMGRSGRRTVEDRFSWEAIAERTLAVYDPGLGKAQPAAAAAVQAENRPAFTIAARPAANGAIAVVIDMSAGSATRRQSEMLLACRHAAEEQGVAAVMEGETLRLEGDWDTVFSAVRRCHSLLHDSGAEHVGSPIRFHAPTPPPARLPVEPAKTSRPRTPPRPARPRRRYAGGLDGAGSSTFLHSEGPITPGIDRSKVPLNQRRSPLPEHALVPA